MPEFKNEINSIEREFNMPPESEVAGETNFDDVDLSVLFDFEAAQCEGEPDLIVELIDLYLADFPQQLSAIKDSILKNDEASLKRSAHNLKGSSATLGVISIARLCEKLEQVDFTRSLQKTSAYVNHLEQAFARVRRIFLDERQNRACAAN